MANTPNTIKDAGGIIAKAAAGLLADKVQFIKSIDKADETDFDGKNGYKAGDTIYVNKPAQFTYGTGADISSAIQDIKEEKVALQLATQSRIAVEMTSADIATDLSLKSWMNRVLEPQMSTLASGIESAAMAAMYKQVYNVVGSAGSTVFDTDNCLAALQKLDEHLAPMDDNRFMLLNPAANRSAVNARKGLFQSSEEIAKQYKSGYMGQSDGFTFLRNNLIPTHTNGNDVTGVAVEASVVTIAEGMTTLGVDGLTNDTGTVKAGSVFTISGVYDVHPITKGTLPSLKQFVVTADATANASGQATLSISPAIYSSASGALQTVSALPVDETGALTFVGAASTGYAQNLAFHKSAFRFASVPLITPDGVHMAEQKTVDGITARVIQDYTVTTDKMIMRVDVLWGIAAVRPEWACRNTA